MTALAIAQGIALGGCSPVETWRSLSGISKNDPDPETAPFSRNLAEGEAAPYPNLASVPPPPTRATSTAERQKLTESLIADRSATAALGGYAAPPTAAEAKPAPPSPAATLASAPVAAPSTARPPSPAAAPLAAPAPASPAAALAASPRSKTVLNSAPSGRRTAGEPPEPSPLDSSLQMPETRSVPEPEAMRPPPPAPGLASVSRPAVAAEPASPAFVSAMPQPAPPVPDMAPVAPSPAPVISVPKRAPTVTTVATLDIPPTATGAGSVGRERAQVERVAALYKEKPGSVRVIGYAADPAASAEPLGSYRAALERAQAVAKALAEAGIPAGKIQTEATPAAGARDAGRVDIQFAR